MTTSDGSNDVRPASTEDVVHRLAGLLVHGHSGITAGDVASLRRMMPSQPTAAFFKLAGIALEDVLTGDARRREEEETRWATIVVGLAILGRLHKSHVRLGRALAEAGFSELRFSRLLRAGPEQLVDELPTLARFLAAKGVEVNWAGAARLLLYSGRKNEESERRAIARDYYRSVALAEQTG